MDKAYKGLLKKEKALEKNTKEVLKKDKARDKHLDKKKMSARKGMC